jgi:hypothetical protein
MSLRSERLICREVQVNLAYRRFCKLSIEKAVPDHSAFSRARNERFREGDIFRRVFEWVVEACIAAGLVGGEGFAVDASLIQADTNKQRSITGQDWHKDRDPKSAGRAVKEYLPTLDDTAWGAASDVVPKLVSPSDPAAQWTGAHKGPAFFVYSDNYLIDVKFGVIVDVEASRDAIRRAEVGAAKTERTEERASVASPGGYIAFDTRDRCRAKLSVRATAADVAGADFSRVHPMTGPVSIEGTKRGDALAVTVVDIAPNDYGYTAIAQGFGFLRDVITGPSVRANTKQQTFAAMRARIVRSTAIERGAALDQIGLITRGRIDALVKQ